MKVVGTSILLIKVIGNEIPYVIYKVKRSYKVLGTYLVVKRRKALGLKMQRFVLVKWQQ